MMDWQDEGVVLAARKHGENNLIVSLLTHQHGRHAGLVRGGAGVRARGLYQPGNLVSAVWRARLSEHLGTLRCELLQAYGAVALADPLKLAGLSAVCAVIDGALPERDPHPQLFSGLLALLQALDDGDISGPAWAALYVRWELGLLAELGFGLDLSRCAATGSRDDLCYVSPKTGRAVSATAAAPYRDRLLPLPAFLLSQDISDDPEQVVCGLQLTGYFLERHLLASTSSHQPHHVAVPVRTRFVERLRRGAGQAVEN